MTLEDYTEFIYKCEKANIDIPNDVIALIDDFKEKVPREMHHLIEVEYLATTMSKHNIIDKDFYEGQLKKNLKV